MSSIGARMATIGTFDGVHRGHQAVLMELKSMSETLGLDPMVVTFDRHPLELIDPERAPRLLMRRQDRSDALRQIVPYLAEIKFDEAVRRMTAAEFMAMLRDEHGVKALILGFNHRFGSDGLQRFEQFEAEAKKLGMAVYQGVEQLSDEGRLSSTIIRQSLLDGNVESAAKCLTRPYRIVGHVTTGKQLGRQIGFPTANLVPCEQRQLVPKAGVYACKATCEDCCVYPAMVNIGVRPTVDSSGHTTIEAHLFDFDGDLYGTTVAIDFMKRIRDERSFPSLETLTAQLHEDAEFTRKLGL